VASAHPLDVVVNADLSIVQIRKDPANHVRLGTALLSLLREGTAK
jgi:hypothetical protein